MFKKENIILIVSALGILFLITRKKKKTTTTTAEEMGKNIFTAEDAKNGLEMLAETRGKEIAKIAERVLRWETNHFRSKQYQKTGSAGMEVGAWQNLPIGMESIPMIENRTGKTKRFIVWGSPYAFLNYFADYVERWGGNWARWYSTSPQLQAQYRAKVNTVRNRIIT